MLSHYAPNLSVASSKISQSALPLLVWHLTTSAFKQNDKIRASDLISEVSRHLGKYLCLTAMFLADFFILTDHAVMSTYNNNTHTCTSY